MSISPTATSPTNMSCTRPPRSRPPEPTSSSSGRCATMIESRKPVVSVCAVRTGSGKSQTSRKVALLLKAKGRKVAAIRHPMPYGDLAKQKVQRFAAYADLDKHECTIEEREEYEPHIDNGIIIYSGVDYGAILKQAEKEADVILWDGGNNDFSVLQVRPRDRRGRPAPGRTRAPLLSGRDELPPGRRHRHQQDGHGRKVEGRPGPREHQEGQSQGRRHQGQLQDHRRERQAESPASASWSSRTARP